MAYAEDSPEALAKEGYDAQAQRYLEWTLSEPTLREQRVEKALGFLFKTSSASVLELGCGPGIPATKMLAEKCRDGTIIANDISSSQISLARKHLARATNVSFIEDSMMNMEFNDDNFDVVVALYSIIHLNPGDQKLIFERMRRWIKPGGDFACELGGYGSSRLDFERMAGHEGRILELFWTGRKSGTT